LADHGRSDAQWSVAESRALFATGTVSFKSLWNEALVPTGSNGGETVGADLLAGGRGNRFTRAPRAFVVEEIAAHELRPGSEPWSVRAVAIQPYGWIEDFAPAPVFPQSIRQLWLNDNVPDMSDDEFDELIAWLRLKRWTQAELTARVYPLRQAT
jgi:hypothetical protein